MWSEKWLQIFNIAFHLVEHVKKEENSITISQPNLGGTTWWISNFSIIMNFKIDLVKKIIIASIKQ